MVSVERACRECHYISDAETCPQCGSTNLSKDVIGFVHILNHEESVIAKKMGVDANGKWALKVR